MTDPRTPARPGRDAPAREAPRPQPEAEPAHAVTIAASERAAIRRRRERRSWRRGPAALAGAAVLHGVLFWWLHQQLVAARLEREAAILSATLDQGADALEPEPEPEEPLPPPVDPTIEPEPTESRSAEADTDGILGLGGGGDGGTGGPGLTESAGVFSDPDEGGGFLRLPAWIGELRQRGVEVAFVVDATGSMQSFIDRARDTIDGIARDLSAVVPGVRLAAVAYRDTGDEWVTRHADFADHPWLVSNFLWELQASGGMRASPDFEEAVEVGLEVATEGLTWTEGARRVLVVVGDAPWHDEDVSAVMGLAREFSRGGRGQIHTIHVGQPGSWQPTDTERRAREAWVKLAEAGDGESFELALPRIPAVSAGLPPPPVAPADEAAIQAALHGQVLAAAFGPERAEEVKAFLSGQGNDPRADSVARRVARGDRAWLTRKLQESEFHPALVDACEELWNGPVAAACLKALLDEQRPMALRWAMLSVLRRCLPEARVIPFDPRRPVGEQSQSAERLRRRVAELPGAAGTPAVPPPPRGA